jgi:hypothetical protein
MNTVILAMILVLNVLFKVVSVHSLECVRPERTVLMEFVATALVLECVVHATYQALKEHAHSLILVNLLRTANVLKLLHVGKMVIVLLEVSVVISPTFVTPRLVLQMFTIQPSHVLTAMKQHAPLRLV